MTNAQQAIITVEIILGVLAFYTQENTTTANGHLVLAGTLLGEQCSMGKILQDEYLSVVRRYLCTGINIVVLG